MICLRVDCVCVHLRDGSFMSVSVFLCFGDDGVSINVSLCCFVGIGRQRRCLAFVFGFWRRSTETYVVMFRAGRTKRIFQGASESDGSYVYVWTRLKTR